MKLGIISDAHHYWDARGRLCVLGPVARQFEQWAQLFEHVTVCAPLARGMPPATHSPYEASNIELLPVRVAGGNTIVAKLELALQVVPWWQAIQTLLGSALLLAETGDSPADLRANVTSPGGTTAAGLRELERSGVRSAFYEAVAAATARSKELGG